MKEYQCIPFWSWNDKLEPEELRRQIRWMNDNGVGGFFMHARGGLKTEYLSEEWMQCVDACIDEAEKLGMDAWAYDENGWPSGFAGGALLVEEGNRDCFLTHAIGAFDAQAFVSYRMNADKLIRVQEDAGEGEYLNVYRHVSPSTADVLNPKVVRKFIDYTHERYYQRYGEDFSKKIKGFFTDEPQYYSMHTPYTDVLPEYFKEQYQEDILEYLGLLFVEKEGYRAFRYKYWSACQKLILTSYAKQVYTWCEEHGVSFTGHYVEEQTLGWQMRCCGGIMPFYKYMHRPGIDWLGRPHWNTLMAKQLSSVVAQYGKKHALTETFGCCGWDITPMQLKTIADFQYVDGVNQMCQHLMPYSEHGQRKRDFPAHYSDVNPWVKHYFKEFNDYFTQFGYLNANSTEVVRAAVLHPIRSAYFDFKREEPGYCIKEFDDKFAEQRTMLTRAGLMYHFLDETLLSEDGFVKNGKIGCGRCSYEYLILPTCYTMDKTTEVLVRQFVEQGGKVLLLDEKPRYVEGEEYAYDYLESNTTLEEILANQPYAVNNRDLPIHMSCRQINGETFLCVQNYSDDEECEVTFTLKDEYMSFEKYDLMTKQRDVVPLTLQLKPGRTQILFFSKNEASCVASKKTLQLKPNYEVVKPADNYLLLDTARYSKDGINYSRELPCMGIFQQMLKERYDGILYLSAKFHVKEKPEHLRLLAETGAIKWVKVNGTEVVFTGPSDFERNTYQADIAELVTEGDNEILVCTQFYQSEDVYYALFGENVTESLRNCMVYNTDIEPMYLVGDFGVYEEKGLKPGQESHVWIGERFYIDKQPKKVTELVQDGFPFFAGNIRLKQTVVLEDTNVCLEFAGKFQAAKIFANGKEAGVLLLDNQLDISPFVKVGENEIEVELTVSNRNLMGPHHLEGDESPLDVGVDSFELSNTWAEGMSPRYRESYSFVKVDLC